MKFLTPLKDKYIDGGWYEMTEELVVADGNNLYIVPKEFLTDFASTPRWLHFLFPPRGPWSKASVLHDFLYWGKQVSRFKADWLFFKAMRATHVSLITSLLFFIGVRLIGWWYY